MKSFKPYILFLTSIPIIFVLAISLTNYNKQVRIKLLTWTSPQISLGLVMIVASTTGAFLSALNNLSISHNTIQLRRKVHIEQSEIKYSPNQQINEYDINQSSYNNVNYNLERNIAEPSPTVSVPYKVLSKPNNNLYTNFNDNDFSDDKQNFKSEFQLDLDSNTDDSNFSYDNEYNEADYKSSESNEIFDWGDAPLENW